MERYARAQLISQCVDATQLNVPPQQQPITLSLTKVTLDYIPDMLAHSAHGQSELWEARQAFQEFNGGNTLEKREATDPRGNNNNKNKPEAGERGILG